MLHCLPSRHICVRVDPQGFRIRLLPSNYLRCVNDNVGKSCSVLHGACLRTSLLSRMLTYFCLPTQSLAQTLQKSTRPSLISIRVLARCAPGKLGRAPAISQCEFASCIHSNECTHRDYPFLQSDLLQLTSIKSETKLDIYLST